jgi:hypothetical protein
MDDYIIEDNFDFFKELSSSNEDVINNDNNSVCLLNKEPLDKNAITLECNHTFNFIPLYHEICTQKKYNGLEVTRLKTNQIKCPYCRHINNKLLPHIKINDSMHYLYGVNSPTNLCMINNQCSYTFKSGKNKNNCCSKPALYCENNYYCNQHTKHATKKVSNNIIEKSEIPLCKAILKTGKNKGSNCKCKSGENSDYCKRHNK